MSCGTVRDKECPKSDSGSGCVTPQEKKNSARQTRWCEGKWTPPIRNDCEIIREADGRSSGDVRGDFAVRHGLLDEHLRETHVGKGYTGVGKRCRRASLANDKGVRRRIVDGGDTIGIGAKFRKGKVAV